MFLWTSRPLCFHHINPVDMIWWFEPYLVFTHFPLFRSHILHFCVPWDHILRYLFYCIYYLLISYFYLDHSTLRVPIILLTLPPEIVPVFYFFDHLVLFYCLLNSLSLFSKCNYILMAYLLAFATFLFVLPIVKTSSCISISMPLWSSSPWVFPF